MNQAQQGQLAAQKAIADCTTKQMHSLNIPSRDDVVRLGESVRKLDQRLEGIEQVLSKLVSGMDQEQPINRAKRTKQPPLEGVE